MYTVKELAQKTGLTPRTLRYYDAIGLLHPARATGNDYRLYGPQEIDRLEQILLYRACWTHRVATGPAHCGGIWNAFWNGGGRWRSSSTWSAAR